jgi:hypothetical protein
MIDSFSGEPKQPTGDRAIAKWIDWSAIQVPALDKAPVVIQHPARRFRRVTVSVWSGQIFLK